MNITVSMQELIVYSVNINKKSCLESNTILSNKTIPISTMGGLSTQLTEPIGKLLRSVPSTLDPDHCDYGD